MLVLKQASLVTTRRMFIWRRILGQPIRSQKTSLSTDTATGGGWTWFINLTMKQSYLEAQLSAIQADLHLGVTAANAKTVVVDFSSQHC